MQISKTPDSYIECEPWKIIERIYHADKNAVSESIFSLANQHMGVRGYFEEGQDASVKTLQGSYFGGIYEKFTAEGSAYKGISTKGHYMVNGVNWLKTAISVDGEALCLPSSKTEGFIRSLDMRDGSLVRNFVWTTESGKKISVIFKRLLSMTETEYAYQKIIFTPLNFSGTVKIRLSLDFATRHWGNKGLWSVVKKELDKDVYGIMGKTKTTGQKVFSAFTLSAGSEMQNSVLFQNELEIGAELELPLTMNKENFIERRVTVLKDKDGNADAEALWSKGAEKSRLSPSYKEALEENKKYWGKVWDSADIIIKGDMKNQQGIRYCLFQLTQTYNGSDPSDNIGAKGLTGEAYSGHAFWDTEIYCLPFYIYNNPAAAKNLLEFRYKTLPNALARAKELDCDGACYPIATLNGDEACNLWQHASLQFQPSTGVAYGIWHYVHVTEDREFLFGHGIEMLVQICRFLYSRGQRSGISGKFGYYGVMGPDEFQMMVNNNCYTNFMAKKTFQFCLSSLDEFKAADRARYDEFIERLALLDIETEAWADAAESMIIPEEKSTGIFEQHEGFFDLPHIDITKIPTEDFPLYHNWSYDRIYRNDMIKQPDVLMFMFLYSEDFTAAQKKVNYDYYEPRTIHESSLSPSVHSVLAAELGYDKEARDFFSFVTRMDIDNFNRNTNEGLHTPSIAAAWVNIVYGFGGMRSGGDMLSFSPTLPAGWDGYSFRLVYRGIKIEVEVGTKEIKFTASGNLKVKIFGVIYNINQGGIAVNVKN